MVCDRLHADGHVALVRLTWMRPEADREIHRRAHCLTDDALVLVLIEHRRRDRAERVSLFLEVAGCLLRAHTQDDHADQVVRHPGDIFAKLPFTLLRLELVRLALEVDLGGFRHTDQALQLARGEGSKDILRRMRHG
jgi:hypothetical protein